MFLIDHTQTIYLNSSPLFLKNLDRCFPDVSAYFGRSIQDIRIKGSMDCTKALPGQANVAVVRGVVFGCDSTIRFSIACSLE
jgi:hypothetical protein